MDDGYIISLQIGAHLAAPPLGLFNKASLKVSVITMRKPAKQPSFEDYFLGHPEAELVAQIIRGHLAIEAVLIELIRLRDSSEKAYKLRFPDKTECCVKCGFISPAEKAALDAINDLRNDCAHILGYAIKDVQVFDVLQKMGSSGIEFSDDRVWSDLSVLQSEYGIESGVWEILHNAFHHIASVLVDNGGASYLG